jgi:hypothetical protein
VGLAIRGGNGKKDLVGGREGEWAAGCAFEFFLLSLEVPRRCRGLGRCHLIYFLRL